MPGPPEGAPGSTQASASPAGAPECSLPLLTPPGPPACQGSGETTGIGQFSADQGPVSLGSDITRRPSGEDAIYFDTAKNRYVGSVSLGYAADEKRVRRKVSAKTRQEVRDKLKALHKEMDAGVKS